MPCQEILGLSKVLDVVPCGHPSCRGQTGAYVGGTQGVGSRCNPTPDASPTIPREHADTYRTF